MSIDYGFMQYWRESALLEVEGQLLVPPEWDSREGLILVRRTMVEVIRGSDELFRKPSRERSGRPGVVATKLGRLVEECLGVDVAQIYKLHPFHRFDPYFDLFAEAYRASPLWYREYLRRDVDQLNAFVDDLRDRAKRQGFRTKLANHERGAIKNGKTVERYLNRLYEDYPKQLHVRIDLHYEICSQVSDEEVKADFAKLMRHVRREFGATAIGHIWTAEWGELKGLHIHLLLHFNGQKVREGITIARQLGEHWQHAITNGRGRYWNINKREDWYEAQGRRGIGLISHSDEKRRNNLLRTALYLVKPDFFVRMVRPGFGKTFGHGRLRPRKKSNAGRKRKGYRLQAGIEVICTGRGGLRRP